MTATDRASVYLATVILNPKLSGVTLKNEVGGGISNWGKNLLRNWGLRYLELTQWTGNGVDKEQAGIQVGSGKANNVCK